MFQKKNGGQDRSVLYRAKVGIAVCFAILSGGMLAWNAYAKAEEYATGSIEEITDVTVHVDKQPLGADGLETSGAVEVTDSDPGLSDVADPDTSKEYQNPELALADSPEIASLDVIDTGSSVEFPQVVGDVEWGIEYQKANMDLDEHPVTDLNGMIDQGSQLEVDSNDMIEQDTQPLETGASIELPVTNTADAQAPVSGAGSQLKDASSDAASSETTGLPYAVVLALLALIGLVPVVRRDDHHRVRD